LYESAGSGGGSPGATQSFATPFATIGRSVTGPEYFIFQSPAFQQVDQALVAEPVSPAFEVKRQGHNLSSKTDSFGQII
jgi:hypothetical protein